MSGVYIFHLNHFYSPSPLFTEACFFPLIGSLRHYYFESKQVQQYNTINTTFTSYWRSKNPNLNSWAEIWIVVQFSYTIVFRWPKEVLRNYPREILRGKTIVICSLLNRESMKVFYIFYKNVSSYIRSWEYGFSSPSGCDSGKPSTHPSPFGFGGKKIHTLWYMKKVPFLLNYSFNYHTCSLN